MQYTIKHFWDGALVPQEQNTTVSLSVESNGDISCSIESPFYNDPPPQKSVGSTWELWNYEVVEIFFVGANGHYLEAEFGPHGHYLLLKLDAPRNIVEKELPIKYTPTIRGQNWFANLRIPKAYLPDKTTHFNLFAIHGVGPNRVYMCYHPLPAEKPDFHQPHCFPSFP